MEITLPKVSFCNHQISKLLIGDNPIYGYSHFNKLLSQHQQEFHTPEQVVATLKRAEEVGINGWQNSVTERSMSDLQRYRDAGRTYPHFFFECVCSCVHRSPMLSCQFFCGEKVYISQTSPLGEQEQRLLRPHLADHTVDDTDHGVNFPRRV